MVRVRNLSVIILAGGDSSRMGTDKAFLLHNGEAFVSAIAAQMSKVSDDIVVMTGKKEVRQFEPLSGDGIRVRQDGPYLSNPLGGILSGLGHVRHDYTAVLACDTPLVKAEESRQLFRLLGSHDAAVPVWSSAVMSSMEPLCAVYRVSQAKKAATAALGGTRKTLKRMVALMDDVQYVDVSLLRDSDPSLDSLVDVNTRDEYAALGRRPPATTPFATATSRGGRRV